LQGQVRQGDTSSEVIWLAVLLALFLAANLLTASLAPIVWMDEVMLADPAVNLRLFGRFTSSAWYAQSDQAFWSGYPPLYTLLVSAWLWLAPISPTGVRSLNFMLMLLSCLTLWYALRQSRIVRSPGARLLFVALLLCGFSTSFAYRSGRADTLGLLLVSLLALLMVSKPSGRRLVLVFAVGCLLPWAGLQLVAYVAILAAIATVVTWTVSRLSLVLAAGVVTGGAALGGLYAAKGTLTAYFASARPHTMMSADQGQASPWAIVRKMLTTDNSSFDFSSLLLLPIVVIAAVMAFRQTRENRQLILFFILAIVAVPPILRLLGKYPIYYFWMSFVPMSFLAIFVIDRAESRRKFVALAVFGLVCAAMLVGLPTRLAIALAEAGGRDYGEVSAYIASALKAEDRAYIDFAAYYPAKLRAQKVYLPSYLDVISDAERRDVTIAILRDEGQDSAAFLSKEFGGDWEKAGPDYAPAVSRSLLSIVKPANPYRFVVLRRKAPAK
jgi:hypothetical protein